MKPELMEMDEVVWMRTALKFSLYEFIKYFWSTYDPEDSFKGSWHIENICKELEQVAHRVARGEPATDLLINVPPGSSKTAMTSVFWPVWCWVNYPWMRFITSSHGEALSLRSADQSRDIIRSEKFQEIFPEIILQPDRDTKSDYDIAVLKYGKQGEEPEIIKGGGRVSTSVRSRVIGRHAHVIGWDDLIDREEADSDAALERALSHLRQLSTRKINKKTTVMVGIMQRLTEGDPAGEWLKKRDPSKLRHICLPGEISEDNGFAALVKPAEWVKYYKGDLMDPVRLGWGELHDMWTNLGEWDYAGQVGQNPVPPGGGLFKIDQLRISSTLPYDDQWVQVVRYWDKAGTDEGGAYTVGLKMARLTTGKYFIMDVVRGQWVADTREDIIRSTAEADGEGVLIVIEQEGGSGGKESAQNTVRNLAGFNVILDSPTGKKEKRAEPFATQVNYGNVIMWQARWNDDYLNEMKHFPRSKYKDQVDASSGAFNYLLTTNTVEIWDRSEK